MSFLSILYDLAVPFIEAAGTETAGLIAGDALDAAYGATGDAVSSLGDETISSLSSRAGTLPSTSSRSSEWLREIVGGAIGTGLVEGGEYLYGLGKRKRGEDVPYRNISSGGDDDTPSSILPGESEHSIDTGGWSDADQSVQPIPGTSDKTIVHHYKKGKQGEKNEMTDNRKFKVAPVIVRHYSKYRPPHGNKPIVLSGYRTLELSCGSGKMAWSDVFQWNDKDDMIRQLNVAARNFLSQTQTGYKLTTENAANNEGVQYLLNGTAIDNFIYSYCLYHKKEYVITNQGTTDAVIVYRLITNKQDTTLKLEECIADTTFEQLQYPSGVIRYNVDSANELTNVISSSAETTDLRFNMFKHRYKVRKIFKILGERVIRLRPGDSCVLPVMDKGPWMISRIALAEVAASHYPAGYFRSSVFELRGGDISFTASNNEHTETVSSAGIGIIEKTTLCLSAYAIMRFRHMTFATDAVSNNTITMGVYRKLGTISTADQRLIDKNDDVHKPMDVTNDATNTTNQ